MGKIIPEDKNFCVSCGSKTTYVDRRGFHNWRFEENKRYCSRCWFRIFEYPRTGNKRILFLGNRIKVGKNPRKGMCVDCNKIGDTDIHHLKYHRDNPLKDTIELCNACHAKRHPQKRDPLTGRFMPS